MEKRNMLSIGLGIVLGAAAGYLMYRFVGCRTGTCPITRSPYLSMIFGALLGALIAGMRR
jgi:hypothetical protein